MANGTVVTVEHLFQNTPVRLGFQRRPATEHARIVEVVVAHAIAHPMVAFRCTIDGRSTLNLPSSESIENRLYDVLGGQSSNLLPLVLPQQDSDVPGDESWTGYISAPDISRGKGDEIHIFVNDRPVASTPFHQAIRRGYRTRLMQGRHPVAVLHLHVPANEVDVNVHPTKREVRLRHSWRVLNVLSVRLHTHWPLHQHNQIQAANCKNWKVYPKRIKINPFKSCWSRMSPRKHLSNLQRHLRGRLQQGHNSILLEMLLKNHQNNLRSHDHNHSQPRHKNHFQV
jgi:DNA mismatch repair protein MutL